MLCRKCRRELARGDETIQQLNIYLDLGSS